MSVRNTLDNLLFVLLNSYILTVSFPCPLLSRVMLWHIAKSFLTSISFLNCDYNIVKLYKTNVWSIFASFCFSGLGRGVSTSSFGPNGYVPLNKVWFPGSWVLNSVIQLHHLASMSSRKGFLSALEALDKVWKLKVPSSLCQHLLGDHCGGFLKKFWMVLSPCNACTVFREREREGHPSIWRTYKMAPFKDTP